MRETAPPGAPRNPALFASIHDCPVAVYHVASAQDESAYEIAFTVLEALRILLLNISSDTHPEGFANHVESIRIPLFARCPEEAKDAVDEMVADFNRYWGTHG